MAPFYMDATCVTNEVFNAFVDATVCKADVEQFGWSFVFQGHLTEKQRMAMLGQPWWCRVEAQRGATPRARAPRSSSAGRIRSCMSPSETLFPAVSPSSRAAALGSAGAGRSLVTPTSASPSSWASVATGVDQTRS
ncbi:MAG: hypothetical protein JSS11_03295 [Verrucomicrobia bacterium]|nr:hypothetical protein [Verrucomicrobiota bacterium]